MLDGTPNNIGSHNSYLIQLNKFYKITTKLEYINNSTLRYFSVNDDILMNETLSNRKVVNNTNSTISVGGWSASYNNDIKVYSVRVYNRALTENEIKQNYEIDKERFGI